MTPQQAIVAFWGIEAVALLLVGYAVFELGLWLFKRLKEGHEKLDRAQLIFGVAATVLGLTPALVMGITQRFINLGFRDMWLVFGLFKALLIGLIIEGAVLGAFWYKTRSFK